MYCADKPVIAIAPQIGTSGMPATPSPSPVVPAGQSAGQPFSAVLEQAKSFASQTPGDQATTTHAAPQGSYTPISTAHVLDLRNEMQATPSSLPVSPTGPAEQSLSAILEQAKSFASHLPGDQAAATHIALQGSCSPISDPSKRDPKKSDAKSSNSKTADSKSADPKTSGSQGHGNAVTQASAPISNSPKEAAPTVVVPILPLPVFACDTDIQNLTPDALVADAMGVGALNNHALSSVTSAIKPAAKADVSSGPTSLPTLSKDAAEAKSLAETSDQDSLNPVATKPASTKSTTAGSINAEVAASLTAKLSSTVTSDSRTSTGNVPAPSPAHNVSRSVAETTDGSTKMLAAVKSEIEQALVPPTSAPSAIVPPVADSGNFDPASLQGTAAKATADKSGVGPTQAGATQVGLNGDSAGTTTKNVDATGNAKSQTRKDDSQSSSSSATPDQTTVSVPAKTLDSSQAFSVSGTQTSPTTGDGKTATPGVPHDAGDPKAGQLDQTSTGAAQSQQGETAATYPTSLVHSAKLIERVGEAELRLGIRAGEFGSVDVRTSMIRNQFTAEISTERGELGRAMAAELPSLQNRLSEQRVPVANITLQNQTGNQSTASEQQRPRDGQRMYATNPGSGREEGPMSALVAMEATTTTSGLDIHM
jgi:flagellar hook-length control protein FliK